MKFFVGVLGALSMFHSFSAHALTPSPLKVAIVGDQGLNADSHAVLRLIKNEGTQLFLLPGDFDYKDDPRAWDSMLQETIGDLPLLAVVGNHDLKAWDDYAAILQRRLAAMPDANCTGTIGVEQLCEYQGISIVLSGIGTMGENQEQFIEESLKKAKSPIKLCVWHKNQHLMQAGSKGDEVGWRAYEICREQGAMIITAHEHSYARTKLLSKFESQEVAGDTLQLEPGKSFAVVSGLGGKSIRGQGTDGWWSKLWSKITGRPSAGPHNGAWWAKIYTADQDAKSGVLFCDFYQAEAKAHCYFKNIAGEIVDDFQVSHKI